MGENQIRVIIGIDIEVQHERTHADVKWKDNTYQNHNGK